MANRSQITDKYHRVCLGCGTRYNISALRGMDGNECCRGHAFSRDTTTVER